MEYIEPDEIQMEMEDIEDFEGLHNGEDGIRSSHLSIDLSCNHCGSCALQRFFSYVLGPVVSMKKPHVTRILDSKPCLGLLKYVTRCEVYLAQEGKNTNFNMI